MLRKKQSITANEEWLETYARATEMVSPARMEELTYKTIEMVDKVAGGLVCCSGWIAGKDSIVLQHILQRSGIEFTPIMWRGINEYPAMREYVERCKPKNLVESVVGKFTLEFLEEHPDYLFCQGGTRTQWMAAKWQKQRKDTEGYDLFITGRRLLDGNVCGLKAKNYVRGNTFSPLAEWTHEELLAYIQYYGIELPPFYTWKRGFLLGSVAMGEWTERPLMGLTVEDVWDEIYEIDPSIPTEAAKTLTSAREYMERRNG